MSEESKQEEFANLKSKHEEEIATYQHLWREDHEDKQTRFKVKHDEEIREHKELIKKLEHRIKQMEENAAAVNNAPTRATAASGAADGIVSFMSNAFTGRKPSQAQPVKAADQSLESSQQQVQQNIDAWKSVVQPLEAEIESLKKQLVESNAQLLKMSGGVSGRKSDREYMLGEELKEAQKYLESEKSARTDLEMYVAVLNTQKTVLQEDSDKVGVLLGCEKYLGEDGGIPEAL